MRNKYAEIILLTSFVFLFGCSETSSEQKERYQRCQKKIIENKNRIVDFPLAGWPKDSIINVYNDITQLSIDQFIGRYKIKSKNIDSVLEMICMTGEILAGMNDSNFNKEEFLKTHRPKRFVNEGPIKVPAVDSILRNLKPGDSIPLKDILAAYDSAAVEFIKKKKQKQ